MSNPRRAAIGTPTVTVATASPRRAGAPGVLSALNRRIAPLAVVGLVALTTTLTFVPLGGSTSPSVADPISSTVRTAEGSSRDFSREALSTASASVTPTVAAAESTPSAVAPTPVATPAPSVAAAEPTASATPSETTVEPTPTPEKVVEPAVDWSVAGEEAGTLWTTDSVNVRTGPGTGYDVVSSFAKADEVKITETESDGWQQVAISSGAGWVKGSLLTDTEPVADTPASSSSSSGSSSPGTGGSCSSVGSATENMTSRTISVVNAVCSNFSAVTSYGGYRAGDSGYHGSGQAIDAMISGDAGWELANWARENASSLGIVEVIYQQKIWTSQRSSEGWRSMSDRGSTTANHYDHVHISVG